MRELAAAIVFAALIVGGAIFLSRPQPPRFQMSNGDRPFRLDTKTGEIVSCPMGNCITLAPPLEEFSDAKAQPAAAD